jgi:hypothetical protein
MLPLCHTSGFAQNGNLVTLLPSNGVYFCNLFKSVTRCYLDIHINTTIEIDDSTMCCPCKRPLVVALDVKCFPYKIFQ